MTPPTLDGRYELLEPLGSGGAGEVWRAHDRALSRAVAVKLLARELAQDPETTARFRSEATSAAKLNHPHAVVVYDAGSHDRDYLVMELVDGGTLDDLIATGPLPPGVVAELGRQVAQALGAAHNRGLVHRDVTPGNVLLTREGSAKISDFGIARSVQAAASRLTAPGQVVGTARYLAPEQLRDEAVDARADVYALGLVLHELVTGQPPFGEGTVTEVAMRRLAEPLPRPREVRGDVPAALDDVIARATAADPAQRHADGGELAAALAGLADPDAAAAVRRLAGHEPGEADEPDEPREPNEPDPADDAGHATTTTRLRAEGPPVDGGAATAAPTRAVQVGEAAGDAPAGEPPAGADDGGDDQASPRRRRWPAIAAVALVALVGVGAPALLISGDPPGDDPASDQAGGDGDDSGGAEPVGGTVEITAGDHDPFGGGREHPEDVGNAFDGDPATVWQTQRYYGDPALGGLKPGVGIWFDLGDSEAVDEIVVVTTNPGSSFTVYAGATRPDAGVGPQQWGREVASVADAGREARVRLDGADGPVWLLWLTRLPPAANGDGYRATVADVRFLAR